MKISIVGGGIAGLTTAIALNQLGIRSEIYEQAKEFNEVGAGIMLQPNALKILDQLGLGTNIREKGMEIIRGEITDRNLIPLRKTKASMIQDNSGNKIVTIHRGRLQKVLFDALPPQTVHFHHSYKSHNVHSEKINIQFKSKSIDSDILIGADGIHSKVRKEIFPNSSLRYARQTCWRGIANIQLPTHFQKSSIEAWGRKIRFGFSQISPHEVYWFAVCNTHEYKSESKETSKETLLKMFRYFHPIVTEMIEQTELSKIIKDDISDLRRLSAWSSGRVCLIGDAAHATSPNMGQGGCQGIEDAYYLSHLLARTGKYDVAFEKLEQLRREKVDYVVNNSWRLGKMAHSDTGQIIFKLILKLMPDKVMKSQLDNLYAVDDFIFRIPQVNSGFD